MVKENLYFEDSDMRLSVVTSGGYTVYDAASHIMSVQVQRGADDGELSGMKIIINFEGNSYSEIKDAPAPNEMKTYTFDLSGYSVVPVSVSVAPIFVRGEKVIEGEVSSEVDILEGTISELPVNVDSNFGDGDCVVGQTSECGIDLGKCEFGTKTCLEGNSWDSCVGGVVPSAEFCDGVFDEDCDGTVDEGCSMVEIASDKDYYDSWTSGSLVDSSVWVDDGSSGSVGDFIRNGYADENIREMGMDPYDDDSVLWKGLSNGIMSLDSKGNLMTSADGGWYTVAYDIDNTKVYRFTVWIKKVGNNYGTTYFGLRGYSDPVMDLNGVPYTNPYFWSGDLPQLDTWYLLVAYAHPVGYTGTVIEGGIYDQAGQKVLPLHRGFKFQADTTSIVHRAYLYYYNSIDTSLGNAQYFWGPRMHELADGEIIQ